jgi:hypothetical protein
MKSRLLGLAAVALLAAACSGDDNDSASTDAPPDDAVVVVGTATCSFPEDPDAPDYSVQCEHTVSDPRVSGAEVSTGYTFVENPGSVGFTWAAEDNVITNADGTWRGTIHGVDDGSGGVRGEAHLLGEGAYEGLEYHYYLDGFEQVEVMGWISGGG